MTFLAGDLLGERSEVNYTVKYPGWESAAGSLWSLQTGCVCVIFMHVQFYYPTPATSQIEFVLSAGWVYLNLDLFSACLISSRPDKWLFSWECASASELWVAW